MNAQITTKTTNQQDAIAEEKIAHLITEAERKNFENDAAFSIQICQRFLKVLGVWLPIHADVFSWHTVLSNLSVIICCFGIGIRVIPTGLYIIFDEKRPIEKLRLFMRWIFVIMGALKYTFLRFHRKNIKKCMKDIEIDWLHLECTTSRNIMLEHARFGHLLTRICVAFTYSAATFHTILPFLGNILADQSKIGNITERVTVRRFTVPSHFGLAIFVKTPVYEIVYSSQVLATFMLHSIAIACYSLAVVIVMHACGQLKILIGKLNELVDGGCKMTMYDSVDGRMADIIKHHVRAMRFIISAEKMLRGICLVELIGDTFEMCCLGYFCLLEFRAETNNILAIVAWTSILVTFMFNVFSFCYIGELLTQEYVRVGEVTYMIDWHRLPGKKSLDLGLIITMTHSPVTLTAGGAFQFSMTCFATVMRTTLGYVNMLYTVMD